MYNGATYETGRPQVMWIMMFTSWCPYCESEVPYTQEFYDIYDDSGLVVIGMGFEWGSPYNCEEWTAGYGLTYPLIDDTDFGNDYDFGGSGFNLFTDNGVPHNVVIDHNMEIVYSVPGYWEEGMNTLYNTITTALDNCNLCTCTEVLGDLDHTYTIDDEPIINLMELLRLSDLLVTDDQINHCERTQGDITGDGALDMIDVIAFATMLSEGVFDN